MATMMQLGGWMMWPLLALSVLACAVVIERTLFYGSLGSVDGRFLDRALKDRDPEALVASLQSDHDLFTLFHAEIRGLCQGGRDARQAQDVLDIAGQEIAARLDSRLPLLGVIVRAAPLMGLLGTVLGMISTFSRLAATQGGVDLMILSEGIW